MSYDDASDTTLAWYNRLPELYRVADAVEPSGGTQPLLRFLDLLGTQAGEAQALADEVTTTLTDPELADSAWLPWLAQMTGVLLPRMGVTDDLRRAMIASGTGWRAGTAEAIRTAVLSVLVDDGNPPSVSVGPDPTTPWVIKVVVAEAQAPTPLSLIDDAIATARAKPAGFIIDTSDFYSPPWEVFDGETWDDNAAHGDQWQEIDTAV